MGGIPPALAPGPAGAGALRLNSSVEVYRDMWGAFSAWCLGQSPALTLEALDARDLQAFQARALWHEEFGSVALPPPCLATVATVRSRAAPSRGRHGPSRQHGRRGLDRGESRDSLRRGGLSRSSAGVLVAEAKQLITFLSQARPRPHLSPQGRAAQGAFTWQQIRNRVAVGLQLGAGLTSGDVRVLTLDAPTSQGGRVRERPWQVAVPGNGNSPARETPIAPWAGELLQHWLQVRAEARIEGPFLFPSTRAGKAWSKESQYESAKEVFDEAGFDAADGGSFRLRHTFALRQLRRGAESEKVARWLGVEPGAMSRYRRVVAAPEDVV